MDAPEGSKKKRKYLRQHVLFQRVRRLVFEGSSFEGALRAQWRWLDDESARERLRKEIERDWDDIKRFVKTLR